MHRHLLRAIVTMGFTAVLLSTASSAWANEFTVTSTADAVDAVVGNGECAAADGACTLRAAIMEANATPAEDQITVPTGTYLLNLQGAAEDLGATGDLDIFTPMTILGAGPTATVIAGSTVTITADGQKQIVPTLLDRLVHIYGNTPVTIANLTLQGGTAKGSESGGAILAQSTSAISVQNAVFSDNTAGGSGSAIWSDQGTENSFTLLHSRVLDQSGTAIRVQSGMFEMGWSTLQGKGEIANFGTLNITGSVLTGSTGNAITNKGGTVTLRDSTVGGATARGLENGNSGTITITNATIAYNGEGIRNVEGAVKIQNSIVAGNKTSDCTSKGLTSLGNNIFGTKGNLTLCGAGPGDVVNEPVGAVLADTLSDPTGAGTGHYALIGAATNKAVNTANPAACFALDQRLASRIGACDIGAVEAAAFCGDGALASGEACDDANTNAGDGCTNACATVTAFTVTKAADTNDGSCDSNDCSLREAVIAANKFPTFDTITIADGISPTLTIAGANEEGAATGDLDVAYDVTIIGNGAATTTISASGLNDRLFHIVWGQTLNLVKLKLVGGNVGTNLGSAIRNVGGKLLVRQCIISGGFGTGAIANQNAGAAGTVTVWQSTVEHNTGIHAGGLFNEGRATITQSTFFHNEAMGNTGEGGAIRNVSTLADSLWITHATFADNSAGIGGAIRDALGGGISISNSTVAGNKAMQGGAVATVNDPTQSVRIRDSFLIGNTAATGPTCSGTIVSDGGNIFGDMTGCTDTVSPNNAQPDIVSADAALSTYLAAYVSQPTVAGGGHFPLLMGTAAINALNDTALLDQLGQSCVGGACDVGAVESLCGNAVTDAAAGEQCDDGNLDNADACLAQCIQASCGDNILNIGVEECDDGAGNSATVANACRPVTCKKAHCGDNVQDANEVCDDGNPVNDDACPNTCQSPTCGNGVKEKLEGCDNGAANADTAACTTVCKTNVCGDGHKLTGSEACDDSNIANGDGCSGTCAIEPPKVTGGAGNIPPPDGTTSSGPGTPPNTGNTNNTGAVTAPAEGGSSGGCSLILHP